MIDPHAKNPNQNSVGPSYGNHYVQDLLNNKMLSLRGEQQKHIQELSKLQGSKQNIRSEDTETIKENPSELALQTKISLLQKKIDELTKLIDPQRKNNPNDFWGNYS